MEEEMPFDQWLSWWWMIGLWPGTYRLQLPRDLDSNSLQCFKSSCHKRPGSSKNGFGEYPRLGRHKYHESSAY